MNKNNFSTQLQKWKKMKGKIQMSALCSAAKVPQNNADLLAYKLDDFGEHTSKTEVNRKWRRNLRGESLANRGTRNQIFNKYPEVHPIFESPLWEVLKPQKWTKDKINKRVACLVSTNKKEFIPVFEKQNDRRYLPSLKTRISSKVADNIAVMDSDHALAVYGYAFENINLRYPVIRNSDTLSRHQQLELFVR